MSVNDELVTRIKYEVDPASREVLEEAEAAPKKASASVDKLGKSHKKALADENNLTRATAKMNKEFSVTDKLYTSTAKTAGTLMGSFVGLGLAAGVGTAALAGFASKAISAAEGAKDLGAAAFSAQLSPEDFQTMSKAYTELGGSLQSFANDAKVFRAMTGKPFDISGYERLYERLEGMSNNDKINLMRSWGFSEDLIRIIIETGKGFTAVANGISDAGKAVSAQDLEKLTKLDSAYTSLGNTFGALKTSIYATVAPTITDGLNALNNLLLGLTGNITNLDNAISSLNGKTIGENLKSDDFDTVVKAIDEAEKILGQQGLGAALTLNDEALAGMDAMYKNVDAAYVRVGESVLGKEKYEQLKKEADEGRHHFPEITPEMSMDELAHAEMQAMGGEYRMMQNTDSGGRVTAKGMHNLFVKDMLRMAKEAAEIEKSMPAPEPVDIPDEPEPAVPDSAPAWSWMDAINGFRTPAPPAYAPRPGPSQYIELPPHISGGGAGPGGGADNSSANTTITNHVEVSVYSPDPQQAGVEVVGEVQKALGEMAGVTTLGNGFGFG